MTQSIILTSKSNLRLQILITAVAVILFSIKLVAWQITGSVAILTDALESIVNVVAGALGIYSLYLSAKPRDKEHPYGHGKIEFISAAIEGSFILGTGVLIIYSAIKHLLQPQPPTRLDFGIILVAVTAIINYIVGTLATRKGKKSNSLVLIASGKHLKTDTWGTIGIIIGLVLLYFTHILWLDSITAIIFSFIIIYTGYKIIRPSVAGIMDEADIELLKRMVRLLNESRRENWIDLHNLRVIKYGGTLHMDCHLTVPWYLNVREAHGEVEALALQVRNEFGEAVELFVHSDACVEYSCRICSKQNCMVRLHDFEKRIEWTTENILKDSKHRITTT